MKFSRATMSDLFHLDKDHTNLWQEDELSSILRHQLASPLQPDLASFDAQAAERCFERTPVWRTRSFGELLQQHATDLDLLKLAKEFAKACAANRVLPASIAALLYLLSICAAFVRCDNRITELCDEELLDKIEWAIAQPWLDKDSRQLCEQAAVLLMSRDGQ
jgi:hypothetical protein